MANIILNDKCQRKCAYCFSDNDSTFDIDYNTFKVIVNFVATGIKAVNIIGGEPTLSNDFEKILVYLIKNDFMVQIFTNGMLDDDTFLIIRDIMKFASPDKIFFAININNKEFRTLEEDILQERFMSEFNKYTYIAHTILSKEYDLNFISDIIGKHALQKEIRLGLALPVFKGNNKYLPVDDYKPVGKKIIGFAKNNKDIKINLDCGFPMCMFDVEDLNDINSNKNLNFSFECGQPIDIYPDLSVINCNPLKKVYRDNINDFENIEDLRLLLKKNLEVAHGMFGDKCKKCFFFMRYCSGGCKGFYKPVGGLAQK